MKYHVRHISTVQYHSAVQLARFNLRVQPAPWPGQVVTNYRLTISPTPQSVVVESGPWIVNRDRIAIRDPITRLRVESRFDVDVTQVAIDPKVTASPTLAEIRATAAAHRDLSPLGPASYIYPSPMAPASVAITAWAAPLLDPAMPVLEAGLALMRAIFDEFKYDGTATTIDTPPDAAFAKRRGVCQDFAHIMIMAARGHGLPAAYVSGYLRTLPPPGQRRLVGADATHAWAALWCGQDLGWIGFDPTNRALASTDHIFTAMGRDYSDVSPMDGTFRGGSGQHLGISVDVAPEEEHADED